MAYVLRQMPMVAAHPLAYLRTRKGDSDAPASAQRGRHVTSRAAAPTLVDAVGAGPGGDAGRVGRRAVDRGACCALGWHGHHVLRHQSARLARRRPRQCDGCEQHRGRRRYRRRRRATVASGPVAQRQGDPHPDDARRSRARRGQQARRRGRHGLRPTVDMPVGWYWNGKRIRLLPTDPGDAAFPSAIDDAGRVVGAVAADEDHADGNVVDDVERAAYWPSVRSLPRVLGPLAGDEGAHAFAIRGKKIGGVSSGDTFTPVVWDLAGRPKALRSSGAGAGAVQTFTTAGPSRGRSGAARAGPARSAVGPCPTAARAPWRRRGSGEHGHQRGSGPADGNAA